MERGGNIELETLSQVLHCGITIIDEIDLDNNSYLIQFPLIDIENKNKILYFKRTLRGDGHYTALIDKETSSLRLNGKDKFQDNYLAKFIADIKNMSQLSSINKIVITDQMNIDKVAKPNYYLAGNQTSIHTEGQKEKYEKQTHTSDTEVLYKHDQEIKSNPLGKGGNNKLDEDSIDEILVIGHNMSTAVGEANNLLLQEFL